MGGTGTDMVLDYGSFGCQANGAAGTGPGPPPRLGEDNCAFGAPEAGRLLQRDGAEPPGRGRGDVAVSSGPSQPCTPFHEILPLCLKSSFV